MQKTVLLIKPDGMKKKIVGQIIDRFERQGMEIIGLKLIKIDQKLIETWYAHHKDKPFFGDLSEFMLSMPMVVFIVKGDNAVNRVRNLIGPTDSTNAPKGTIRGDYGESIQNNVVHASDSVERANFEISLLFKPEEIFG